MRAASLRCPPAADDLSWSLAPNVNAGIEDQGPASRAVYARTVDEGERQKALETRQSALKKGGEHTLVDESHVERSSSAH